MAACTLGSDPVAAVIAELMYTNQLPPADQIKANPELIKSLL